MDARIARIQQELSRERLDAFVLTDPHNRHTQRRHDPVPARSQYRTATGWRSAGVRIAPLDERAMLFGGAYQGDFTPEMFRTSHEGVLEQGDIVILETLGSAEDFWIDINRTATIGAPSPEFERLHGIVRDAFLTMSDAMRPRVNTADVHKLGLEHLRRKGVASPEKLIAVAHGVAHRPVEMPVPYPALGLRGARGFPLEQGMVISLDCLYFGAELGPCPWKTCLSSTRREPSRPTRRRSRSSGRADRGGSARPKLMCRDRAAGVTQ